MIVPYQYQLFEEEVIDQKFSDEKKLGLIARELRDQAILKGIENEKGDNVSVLIVQVN